MQPDADLEGPVGELDTTALEQIVETVRRLDGLVDSAGFDSLLDPTEVRITLADGIGDAGWCRFDVRWYQTGYYNIHHTDECNVDFRFDYHPKPGTPDRHFHSPPTASSADPDESCIRVREPKLVIRAVHNAWRRAYETNTLENLNTASNPP